MALTAECGPPGCPAPATDSAPQHGRAVDAARLGGRVAQLRGIVEGTRASRQVRFVKTTKTGRSVDEAALTRARHLIGLRYT